MITDLRWLGLEVISLDRAHAFYGEILGLSRHHTAELEHRYAVGETDLRLKRPAARPRGGSHVHYAFSTARGAYDDWLDQLSAHVEIHEHDFGIYRSIYCFDHDNHCVEIAGRDDVGDGLNGIFEVVLEVDSLERAERFYRSLEMAVLDRGSERTRVRLDAGVFELELWEPQRGLANAQGGEHVDIGFGVADPDDAIKRLRGDVEDVDALDDGYRLVDPDGHTLTFRSQASP